MRLPSAIGLALLAFGGSARAADPEPTIAALEMQLVDDSPAVRAKGATALASRFPDGAAAVPMLLALLDDEDPAVAAAAGTSLDALGVAGLAHIATYVPKLLSQDTQSSYVALDAVSGLGFAKSEDLAWIRGDVQPTLADFVTCSMLPLLDARGSIRPLETALSEAPSPKRAASAAALATTGMELAASRSSPMPFAESPQRTALEKSALEWTRSNDGVTTYAGVRFLAKLRARDRTAVDALSAFSDRSSGGGNGLRRHAIGALAAIGPDAAKAAPGLLEEMAECLVDDMTDVRIHALVRMGRASDVASRCLATKVTSRSDAVDRCFVAGLMVTEGAADKNVRAKLVEAMQATAEGGGRFELNFPGVDAIGEAGLPLVPSLRRLLKSKPSVLLARCLLGIVPSDPEAVAALVAHARTEVPSDAAVEALGRLGATTPAAAAVVRELISEPAVLTLPRATDAWLRADVIVESVAPWGPKAADCVPTILELLAAWSDRAMRDEPSLWHCDFESTAARTLGRIGPGAKAAIPVLETMRTKGDERCRVPAAQALRRIKPAK